MSLSVGEMRGTKRASCMWFGHDPKVIFHTRPFTSRTSELHREKKY